jgi:uncharacterized protein (TIGR02757 family)
MKESLNHNKIRQMLDEAALRYNTIAFIEDDPICIPHQFDMKEDIEIAGFFAAILSWGQRKTIIAKSKQLLDLMSNKPYDFLLNASDKELKAFQSFKHRTFNADDLLAIFNGLRMIYKYHGGLEKLMETGCQEKDTWQSIIKLNQVIFSYPHLNRSRKHISNPETGSAAKRLHMFLRWMVRKDNKGVDFGIWKGIAPAQLLCPLDVHVAASARKLGLLNRRTNDRKTVDELTANLRLFDPVDPVRYDFALFGMSKYETTNH